MMAATLRPIAAAVAMPKKEIHICSSTGSEAKNVRAPALFQVSFLDPQPTVEYSRPGAPTDKWLIDVGNSAWCSLTPHPYCGNPPSHGTPYLTTTSADTLLSTA